MICVLSTYLRLSDGQETQSTEAVVFQSKGNYENNSEESVWQGGLDNHEDDGVIGARIILCHGLPPLTSHGEQTMHHENGIHHIDPHFDAKVAKLDVDIIKYETGARLHLGDNRQYCSKRQ